MKTKPSDSIETDASFTQGHHGKIKSQKNHQFQGHFQRGRFDGVNRYGEDHPHASHYDENDHRIPWSDDLRSEAHGQVDHAGKGPRGYKRRDERILEDVCEVLKDHPDIDPTDLHVSVSEGVVHLSGSLRSDYEMQIIDQLVSHVSGSKNIINKVIKNES